MQLLITPNWPDYELLDSGNAERLERFGQYIIRRPDPEALWERQLSIKEWQAADLSYRRTHADKGQWHNRTNVPAEWLLTWHDFTFLVKPTPFKHLGLFPEQAGQWSWLQSQFERARTDKFFPPDYRPQVLNAFAYTGGASMVCARAGAKVTHLDASKASLNWARRNQELCGLPSDAIRWMFDDAQKFLQREVRRGSKYDGILLDPPAYGHGPKGERWYFKENFSDLMTMCSQLLSERAIFLLVNAYAVSTSSLTIGNVVSDALKNRAGTIEVGELALKQSQGERERVLSTGIWARWQR